MPTSEHKFSIHELIGALLRDQHIHEGHWALNIEFSATGASVKPQNDPSQTLPGLIVSMNSATLVQAEPTAPGAVDAAMVNPRKESGPAKPAARARKPSSRTLQ